MNAYNSSLIIAEILSIIFAAIWIVYKINKMEVSDVLINIGTYSLMIYVAVGNLLNQVTKIGIK